MRIENRVPWRNRAAGAVVAVLIALTLPGAARAPRAAEPPPNIVYIVADDLGWKDVGYHGSDIATPNIDRLAATGARLEQFYAQPMCTPTRAALMTGRYPFRYGLQTLVIPSGYTYGLPTDEWLLPQALKQAGYETAIVGKWHLGHADPKFWPRQRGFDYQYGALIGEIDYFTHEQHGVLDWYRDNKPVKEAGYSTTLLGNDAVRYVESRTGAKPFCLYLAFNAPHTPYQATQVYLDRYKHIADPSRRAYAASITALDDQVGRVLAALERKNLLANTIVVFQSDNGGTNNAMFAGEGDMSKIKIPCDNGPYRDGKGSLYEGGTRVPALVNWPGHVKPSTTVDGMVHVVDIFPTLLEAVGTRNSGGKPLDGVSMWPTIANGQPSPRTEVVYNIELFRAGIRQGDWKLVWRTLLPSTPELYNLAQDPSEKNNLAVQNPERVLALQARVNDLAAKMAKSPLLQAEAAAMMKRIAMPPALPGEEFDFNREPEGHPQPVPKKK
jgi:arylsulfatase A-like enzyme